MGAYVSGRASGRLQVRRDEHVAPDTGPSNFPFSRFRGYETASVGDVCGIDLDLARNTPTRDAPPSAFNPNYRTIALAFLLFSLAAHIIYFFGLMPYAGSNRWSLPHQDYGWWGGLSWQLAQSGIESINSMTILTFRRPGKSNSLLVSLVRVLASGTCWAPIRAECDVGAPIRRLSDIYRNARTVLYVSCKQIFWIEAMELAFRVDCDWRHGLQILRDSRSCADLFLSLLHELPVFLCA